jgi:hypothetical protein
MISPVSGSTPDNSNRSAASSQPPAQKPPVQMLPASASDSISKLFCITARSVAVYPTAILAAQFKGGETSPYRAAANTQQKLRRFLDPRSGSGAYVAASTASLLPTTLADPLKNTLMHHGVESAMAEKIALATCSLATGMTTNCRNFAFTSGKHGLDRNKIFRPVPLAASFFRDSATGFVYSRALQARPEEARIEKARKAVTSGAAVGALTTLPDVAAYVTAKEAIPLREFLKRTARVVPVRSFSVALGALVVVALTPEKPQRIAENVKPKAAAEFKPAVILGR